MMLKSILLFLASLLLLSFLSLSMFSSSTVSQTNYPPEYIEEYVVECTGDQNLLVESVCRCVIRKAQDKYDLATFKNINQNIEEGKIEIPEQLLKIINDCQADPFS